MTYMIRVYANTELFTFGVFSNVVDTAPVTSSSNQDNPCHPVQQLLSYLTQSFSRYHLIGQPE